jgi:hypothetical protein
MIYIKEQRAIGSYPRGVKARLRSCLKIALFSAIVLISFVPQLLAAEPKRKTLSDTEQYHPNMVELFLGNTYEDSHRESEDGFTIGLTYERRFSDLLGLGGFYEYAAGDFNKWSIGVPLFIHPYKGWRFDLAPGLEHGEGENEFLFRTGVAYEFELSERCALIPEFNVDFVDGQKAFVFGVSLGIGF